MATQVDMTNRPLENLQEKIASKRILTVYIKPSDYCNVGCDHCYLPESVRADKTRMNPETLNNALKTAQDMMTRQRAAGILIVWHGGEPLSLPVSHFETVAQLTAQTLPNAIQSLQTSLIPYGERWRPLVENHFDGHIGSSIDFTQRTLKGSAEAYQAFWMKKVELARSHGFHITPGMVPSKQEIGKGRDIVDWFVERGFDAFNIDRYNQHRGFDPMRPLNREHSTFLTEVFDRVLEWEKKGVTVKVNTVTAALRGILMNLPGDRWGGSCSMDFLVINPDGSTNACPDKISFETFSNVNEGGYEALVASQKRKDWIRMHISGHRNPDCPTCAFNTFCKSGCPLTPNDPTSEGECSGYNRHLAHVQNCVQNNRNLVMQHLKNTRTWR